jgi:microcystin degradation protein MlrC
MALHQIPMMWGMNQVTAHSPMKEAIEELHRIESLPGVVCGSIATCFPLADVPDLGASVYIVTENDQSLAQQYADELGAWLFHRKASWHFHMLSTREALATIHTDEKMPVIFADRDDNTGGGSPGDSTGMLKTFIEAELEDACILYIVDTEAVNQCMEAGIGATIALEVGGKSSPLQGHPISMTVEIMALSDGRFRYHGPMLAGLEGDMGPSAYIREKGIHVLLVSEREQPFDTAFSETLGLDPRQMRFIGVKSSAHFRAGFESWAGAIHVVTEPGVHDASHVSFHRLSRKIYPIDDL